MVASREPRSAFISYAGTDRDWAFWIAFELEALGIKPEIAERDWSLGASIPGLIEASLQRNELFVPLFSEHYFGVNRWTEDEIAAAYNAHRKRLLQIVPICLTQSDVPLIYQHLTKSVPLANLTESAASRVIESAFIKFGVKNSDDNRTVTPPKYPGRLTLANQMGIFPIGLDVKAQIDAAELYAKVIVENRPDMTSFEIDLLHGKTQALLRSYNYESPYEMLSQATPVLSRISEALANNREPSIQIELHELAARVLAVLAYASLDLGRPQQAMSHAVAGERSAQLAGNPGLEAWSDGTQALILRFNSLWKESIERAEKGLGLNVAGSERARLYAAIAAAAAKLGDRRRVEEALKCSDDDVDSGPSARGLGDGILLFPRAKHHYYAGSSLADLADIGAQYGDESVEQSMLAHQMFQQGDADVRSYSDELLSLVHAGQGLLLAGRLDEIPSALVDLFESPVSYRTAWHANKLASLVRDVRVRAPGSIVAEDLEVKAWDFARQIKSNS